jgi:hypothetical protein
MADKTSSKPNTLAFPPTSAASAGRRRRKSLIEWDDPSRPAHVLDWRQRAQGFGLEVDEREETDEERPFAVTPERLLRDDEPEAFADQSLAVEEEVEEEEEEIEQPEEGASREDVDLVRLYLQHIGKRRLLKAHEEVTIGQRIETAQRDLVAALGEIPAAVQTLVALADRIRGKADPAAELILLPEGGELRDGELLFRQERQQPHPARVGESFRDPVRCRTACVPLDERSRAQKSLGLC